MVTDIVAAPTPAPADRTAHICQVTDKHGGRATAVIGASPNRSFERSCTSADAKIGDATHIVMQVPSRDLLERVSSLYADGICDSCLADGPCPVVQAAAPVLQGRGLTIKPMTWKPEEARPAPGQPGSVENPIQVPPPGPEYTVPSDERARLRHALEAVRGALRQVDSILARW